MVYSYTVKLFPPFLIALTVIAVSPVLRLHAAPILGEQDCRTVEGRQPDPVDRKTEVRFRRYAEGSASPKTFANITALERWCFLWDEEQTKDVSRRERKMEFRTRTLPSRFYDLGIIITERKEERVEPFFAPETDKELKDLPPNRRARVRARITNRNCHPGGGTDRETKEYAICLKELKKITDAAGDHVEGGRLVGSASRTEQRRRNAITPKEDTARTGYGKDSPPEDEQSFIGEEGKLNETVFDPQGAGSAPLSAALENRVRSYVESRDCHRVTPPEAKTRCLWLVQSELMNRQGRIDRAQIRLRTFGVLNGAGIRRGIDTVSRKSIGSVQAIDRQRRLLGFRPSPRTIQEIKENYGEPVVVPGDCQVDPKLCNK